MRVCITGLAGFLGHHLALRLTELGHEVAGIDLVSPYAAWRVLESGLAGKVEYHWGSVADQVRRVRPVDIVIHCAAVTNVPFAEQNREHTLLTMARDQIAILEAMQEARWARRLIQISTHSVYGLRHRGRTLYEDMPCSPSTTYGVAKLLQENLALQFQQAHAVPVTILRQALLYGNAERDDAIFTRFIRRALAGETISLEGGGYQTRDFNHVQNAVDAVLAVIELHSQGDDGINGEVFNISSGEQISIRQLALAALEYAERGRIEDLPARPGEEGNILLDYHKAERDLGYRPRVFFDEAFFEVADWVKNRDLAQARAKAAAL